MKMKKGGGCMMGVENISPIFITENMLTTIRRA
jgi:hypothetical protein